jgi:hypothetical protein
LVTSSLCCVVPPLPFDLHCSCPFDLDVIFFGRGTAASRTHGHNTCHPHPVLCLPHRARCRRAHCVSLACLILVSGGVFPFALALGWQDKNNAAIVLKINLKEKQVEVDEEFYDCEIEEVSRQ